MSKNKNLKNVILLVLFAVITLIILLSAYKTGVSVPDKIGKTLTKKEEQQIIAENSPLTSYAELSPHADFPRKRKVTKITIHHMAGDYTLKQVGRIFSYRDRKVSSNYGIDSDGKVGLYVEEKDRSWASGNEENDNMAVTIEVANDEIKGEWHVSDQAFDTLIDLCADICRRNGIRELVFTGDANGNLTFHKMFKSNTDCPGPYLISRMKDIETLVNEKLKQ